MPKTLIRCRDVSFSYDSVAALRGVSFEVNAGDALCVVGENGSGKSTLMSLLLRLKAPQSGSIVFDGGLRADQVGYLPQQTAAQKDFPASVREVVMSGRLSSRRWQPFYTRADRAMAERHMEKLGVLSLANRCYRELSGGQQQRTLLARALCATKTLLLLDEPVAGLDPLATSDLYQMIDAIRSDGVTIIMVSHDVQSVMRHATSILHLRVDPLFFGGVGEYAASATGRRFLTNIEGVGNVV
ncbi:MAG: metal ABC transporter ATP-binding protein [Oscillospiraceae bacterium]|jgi:zinc transport system ATP-binding protein|nr:metal ABC transporter ATP-binding protein [Oscillospiraceae bacterium]